jgi:hypothetical protein
MLTDIISFKEALELESKGLIYIFDMGEDISYHERAKEWQDNCHLLRTKARNVSIQDLPRHYQARYLIEYTRPINSFTTQWMYLRAIDITSSSIGIIKETTDDDTEYVYALSNPAYPSLVKIGMTTKTPTERLNQINGTGTVDLWELLFSIPVRPGTAMNIESEVHNRLQDCRLHIKRKNDREMFKIDALPAIDIIREVANPHKLANPTLY